MTSNELTTKKGEFATAVDSFKEKYEQIYEKADKINSTIEESYDTELSRFLYEQNAKLKKKMETITQKIEEHKKTICSDVDNEISKLKQQEELAAQQAAKEAEEAKKQEAEKA